MWILTAVSIAQAAALTPTATPKRLLQLFAPREDAVLCSPTTKAPLAVMSEARKEGHIDLAGYAQRLTQAGYPVYSTDEQNMQVQLSACAGSDGKWVLAKPEAFSSTCLA